MDRVYFVIFYSLGQETKDPCYTEENVQYKMEEDGLNLEITSTPNSAEECRTYCRHLIKTRTFYYMAAWAVIILL